MRMTAVLRALLAVVCLAPVNLSIGAPAPPPAPTPTSENLVAVGELLDQVKDALGLANERAPKDHAQLDSVTLGLQTVAVQAEDGRITFFIFQFGSATTTTSTSTITLTLSRPEAATPTRFATGERRPPFAPALAELIVAAWQAVEAGRGKIEGLQPTKVSCEISFGVRKEGTRGLVLATVPVSATAGRVSSRQAVQTITITFKSTGQKKSGSPS
jgi:hypothetical protein